MSAPQSPDARAIVVRNDNWRIALEDALHGIFAGRGNHPFLMGHDLLNPQIIEIRTMLGKSVFESENACDWDLTKAVIKAVNEVTSQIRKKFRE